MWSHSRNISTHTVLKNWSDCVHTLQTRDGQRGMVYNINLSLVLAGNNADELLHDDVIKWTHFQHYWPFVRGIHRSPVDSPHKGQWRGALMFSLICAWTSSWVNNRDAGDSRRHRPHDDVTVMCIGLTTIQLCPPIQRQIWGAIQTLTHQLLCIPATLLIQIIRYTTQIKCTFFICWRARICQQCWTTLQRCGPIYPGAFLESNFFCFFEAFDRFWCCTEQVSPTFAVSKTVRCRYNPDKNKSKGCVCMIVITVSDSTSVLYIDGLVQEWRNSIANALDLRLSCTTEIIDM